MRAAAYRDRSGAWHNKKDYDKAIAGCNEAVRLALKVASAYRGRALVWQDKNYHRKAIADYKDFLRLEPKDEFASNRLAWLCTTCSDSKFRDGAKAVAAAKEALKVAPKSSNVMDTLAAAQSENGDFDEAVRWRQRALLDQDFPNREGGQRHLELYRNNQSLRTE